MKKNDWRLAALVLVIAAVFYLINTFLVHDNGSTVTVKVDGEVFGTYSLDEEREIDIGGTNRLVIRDGKADMTWADCPDKLCVHQKAIGRDGETIVCLPNKVVAEVHGPDGDGLDAVAN